MSMQQIPKIIWVFWDGPSHKLVETCMESWRLHNPSYDFRQLDVASVSHWLPNFDLTLAKHETKAKFSDFVRLALLSEYGGVWVDASLFCVEPLDRWIGTKEFCGFYIDGFTTMPECPVIESWFLASTPSPFMKQVYKVFRELESGDDTMKNIEKWERNGVSRQKIGFLPYLCIHFAFQVVMQKELTPTQIHSMMHLYRAEDTAFSGLVSAKWDGVRFMRDICDKKQPLGPYIVKFRGSERAAFNESDPATQQCVLERLGRKEHQVSKAEPRNALNVVIGVVGFCLLFFLVVRYSRSKTKKVHKKRYT